MEVLEIWGWLESRGADTTYKDAARLVKLLLDWETAMSYNKMLSIKLGEEEKAEVDVLVSILCELITSRRLIKSRRKSLFQSYNQPGLMGHEGCSLDLFVSQLNKDMADCKMESFRWTDLSILIMINTLRSSDENKVKLAERLNNL